MIQRCIYITLFSFFIFSCKNNREQEIDYSLIDLLIIDTLVVTDNQGFFQKPSKIELIGDSLVVASSLFSGVVVYDLYSGKQKYLLPMKNKFGINIFASSFVSNNYPEIQILDSRKSQIYLLNIQNETLERKTSLIIPDGYQVKFLDPLFNWHDGNFYVELVPSGVSLTNKNFYNLSKDFIGVFDSSGNLISRFISYPEKLASSKGFLNPLKYHSFSFNNDNIFAAFPSENMIRIYGGQEQHEYKIIDLPKFQHLDFDLIYMQDEFNPNDISVEESIEPALFDAMFLSNGKIYISTYINDNSILEQWKVNTNLLVYEIESNKWKMSEDMKDFLKIGKLAGVVQDTLYFFEASLIESDDKRIYRAIIQD